MKRVHVSGLPDEPLAAAGHFQQNWLTKIEAVLKDGEDVIVALPCADHTHREWRRSMAAGLARRHTPTRCNIVAGEGAAIDALGTYLAAAPGITGHYLETDATGAGNPT